jgi:hypothetical protein
MLAPKESEIAGVVRAGGNRLGVDFCKHLPQRSITTVQREPPSSRIDLQNTQGMD